MVLDRISTRYRHREDSVGEVSDAIARAVLSRSGNYLVYFSSYAYLEAVAERFETEYPSILLYRQKSQMTEAEREAFLARFEEEPGRTLVGFCVLGGIYAEGSIFREGV